MKKIITIVLTLLLTFLCILPSFADTESTETEILEAAKKGMVVANLFSSRQMFYDIYQVVDIKNEESEIYNFMQQLIKYDGESDVIFTTYVPFENEMVQDPESPYWQNFECVYAQTGDLIKSRDDAQKLVDKYLTNFTVEIDDENTVELIDGKYKKHHPKIRTINGEVYVNFWAGNFALSPNETYFDEFEVVSINESRAVVNAPQFDSYNLKKVDLTIELVKENGQWKVCGGTTFSYKHGSFSFYPFSPNTGEDFSLITHTVIITASLCVMFFLTRKRHGKTEYGV